MKEHLSQGKCEIWSRLPGRSFPVNFPSRQRLSGEDFNFQKQSFSGN
jgi:hypothetical protein